MAESTTASVDSGTLGAEEDTVIKKKQTKDGITQITFALPDEGQPVSVVADVNGWDPHVHPMKKRSNGTRSVSITVPSGNVVRFRYLGGDGRFFDDPDADHTEPNGYGETHAVVHA